MLRRLAVVVGVLLVQPSIVGSQIPNTPATLAGVIRDASSAPIPNVEVSIRGTTHATRTNERGEFRLSGVEPGSYRTFFRRLGYRSAEYHWAPASGDSTEITVVLEAIPANLDPVVVRAEEDKRYEKHATIRGIVIDTAGNPIDEAEVRVIGSKLGGITRPNGGFLFTPLPLGAQVIRVRKIGYSPVTMSMDLQPDDDRQLFIRLKPLPHELDPMVTYALSGYDNQRAWDELERRRQWTDLNSKILGPDELMRWGDSDLFPAIAASGVDVRRPVTPSRGPTSIQARPGQGRRPELGGEALACVLLNGTDPTEFPLGHFKPHEVELMEIYPSGTEMTGTVAAYFERTRNCKPANLLQHPTYYVIWLKENSK